MKDQRTDDIIVGVEDTHADPGSEVEEKDVIGVAAAGEAVALVVR